MLYSKTLSCNTGIHCVSSETIWKNVIFGNITGKFHVSTLHVSRKNNILCFAIFWNGKICVNDATSVRFKNAHVASVIHLYAVSMTVLLWTCYLAAERHNAAYNYWSGHIPGRNTGKLHPSRRWFPGDTPLRNTHTYDRRFEFLPSTSRSLVSLLVYLPP